MGRREAGVQVTESGPRLERPPSRRDRGTAGGSEQPGPEPGGVCAVEKAGTGNLNPPG